MSTQTETTIGAVRTRAAPRAGWLRDLFEREGSLGYILMLPALLLLAIFMAYPFVLGIAFALRSDKIGSPGEFVGLANFVQLLTRDTIFWNPDLTKPSVIKNTFYYTFFAQIGKVVLGLVLALLMNQAFRGRNLVRAALLLPYIIPTALSTLAWLWILDSTYGIISWTLKNVGLIKMNIPFLGDPFLAMNSLITVNIWRGTPFFAIGLLAGLQTIPQELYEAAAIDGANAWKRFLHVTLPLIMPVLTIIVLFSVIQTFADFQLIYVLTRG